MPFSRRYEEYVKLMLLGQIRYVEIDDEGTLILHYFDGHVMLIAADEDGGVMVGERPVSEC